MVQLFLSVLYWRSKNERRAGFAEVAQILKKEEKKNAGE